MNHAIETADSQPPKPEYSLAYDGCSEASACRWFPRGIAASVSAKQQESLSNEPRPGWVGNGAKREQAGDSGLCLFFSRTGLMMPSSSRGYTPVVGMIKQLKGITRSPLIRKFSGIVIWSFERNISSSLFFSLRLSSSSAFVPVSFGQRMTFRFCHGPSG